MGYQSMVELFNTDFVTVIWTLWSQINSRDRLLRITVWFPYCQGIWVQNAPCFMFVYLAFIIEYLFPVLTSDSRDFAVSWIGFLKHESLLLEMDPTGNILWNFFDFCLNISHRVTGCDFQTNDILMWTRKLKKELTLAGIEMR